jgi:hypothetical protein
MVFGIIIGIVVFALVVFLVLHNSRGTATKAPGKSLDDPKNFLDKFKGKLERLKEAASAKLSYEEAMKYFIEHKGDSPAIAKGAMLKESAGESVVIFQVFLDKDNQLVENDKAGNSLGCKIKVKQLDDELLRLFKDGNLVIVE